MKAIILVCLGMIAMAVNGQNYIPARPLEVTMNKTTNLIFPAPISSVDRGSERIVVQKSTGNILRVKADTLFTDTTNLTVITADGRLYSFLVNYTASPLLLTINLGVQENVLKDTLLVAFAQQAARSGQHLHGVHFAAGKVRLQLRGIYSNGKEVAIKLRIENNSSLAYEIGRLSAEVTGGRGFKRSVFQNRDVPILLTEIATTVVREKQSVLLVAIIPKTGLANGQVLTIHMQEAASERHLTLTIPNQYILNATLLK
ncbi:MAG: DUF4138 domain-containing protein [Sphingobacteriia bacterium]|nr:DUF4138 domain-containing protein [Sphingobacteriia bacterium]